MYGGYGYYGLGYSLFDPTMILVYIGALLSLWASSKVNSTFQRYSRVRSMTGMTGAEAAKRLLQSQGIYDVTVRPVRGQLTDHYDPRTKTVNLSESVYGSTSIAAVGVAAHECGHAIQDNVGYAPLRLRSAFVPIANLGSKISLPLIILGFFIGLTPYLDVCAGCIIPDHHPAGRVQCFLPRGAAGGQPWHSPGGRGRWHPEGAGCSSAHLCGSRGCFHFTACAADHPVWRTQTK